MAKIKEWTVTINEEAHLITWSQSTWSGRVDLSVDGSKILVHTNFKTNIMGIDQLITIAGKELHLVSRGYNADLAVDGYYLGSKKEYVRVGKIPVWGWLFIALNVAIPIVALGGFLPIRLGFLGATYTARISSNTQMNAGMRVLACLGVTAICWIIMLLVVYWLATLTL